MRRTTEGSLIPNVRSAVSAAPNAAPVSRPAAARRSGRATRAGEGFIGSFRLDDLEDLFRAEVFAHELRAPALPSLDLRLGWGFDCRSFFFPFHS